MKDRIVQVEQGLLRGMFGSDPRVKVFRGVPYAKPPVGDLRWHSPVEAEPWEGIRNCYEYGQISIQSVPGGDPNEFWTRELHPCGPEFKMGEDCLYLNIYTPAKTGEEKLPVFCYIHGGGYQGGYAFEQEFDWEHLAARGVVVVGITYRLGLFGFLAHPELSAEAPDAPKGNYGVEDQCFALKWVQKNIAAFGGDPEKVTIAGQSAGAGSVQTQLTTPFAEGLFRGAIIQSSLTAEFADLPGNKRTLADAEATGEEFFRLAGIGSLEEARAMDAFALFEKTRLLGRGMRFSPVTDGIFLKESTFEALKNGRWHNVPIIAGYNAGEVRMFNRFGGALPKTLEEFNTYLERLGDCGPEFLKYADPKSDAEVAAIFEKDDYAHLIAATLIGGRIYDAQGRKAWLYNFEHEMPGDEDTSAFHGAELWFAYDSLNRSWRPFTGKDEDLARAVSSYWINFIKTGDPNGCDKHGFPLPKWPAYSDAAPKIMHFTDAPRAEALDLSPILAFRMDFTLEQAIK
ncbi:MAG: carboxylesterase family protein [Lachnospiraceae bacterium]|nr:carboxylesterase family protein [Lachnospiraceae bacterium]